MIAAARIATAAGIATMVATAAVMGTRGAAVAAGIMGTARAAVVRPGRHAAADMALPVHHHNVPHWHRRNDHPQRWPPPPT